MNTGSLVILQPMTVVTVQTTLTPLLAMRSFEGYDALLVAAINDSTTNAFDLLVETGEASDALDAEYIPTLTVPPSAGGKAGQRSLIIGPAQLRAFYRISAQATGAPCNARWILKGLVRLITAGHGGVR